MTERTREISWEDPAVATEWARGISGLAYMEALATGQVPAPPIARLLNFELTEVARGRAVFTIEPAEYHYNPIGTVHGGIAATLLDSAMGCAVHASLPAGTAYTTIELHVNYIRPVTVETGRLRCIGELIHLGRSQATAQGRLIDEHNKLYAHSTTTCLVFPTTAKT